MPSGSPYSASNSSAIWTTDSVCVPSQYVGRQAKPSARKFDTSPATSFTSVPFTDAFVTIQVSMPASRIARMSWEPYGCQEPS